MKGSINLLGCVIKSKFNSKNVIDKYGKTDVRSCLIKSSLIPDLNNYVPQGICIVDDNILVSCYDNSKEQNSKVFIFDNEGNFIKECLLDIKSHVGSICYDEKNKNIWVTDHNGTITAYKKNDIFKKEKVESLYKKVKLVDDFINVYSQNAIAYMAIYKNKMYVGNYNDKNKSFIRVFDILKDGNIDTKPVKTIKADDFVQGLTFANIADKEYVIISSSIGYTSSKIKIYECDKSIDNLDKLKYIECVLPRMLEQICFDNDLLYLVFEYNANKFIKLKKNDDIVVVDIKKMLN